MEPLPDITLIGFLDWMDANRFINLSSDQTLEELFLDERYNRRSEYLAKQYLRENHPKQYADTPEGRFEEYLDLALALAKHACMDEARRHTKLLRTPYGYECFVENLAPRIIESALKRPQLYDWNQEANNLSVTPHALVKSLRKKLEYEEASEVEEYLSCLDGTSAKAVKDFLAYFREQTNASKKNDNVPLSVIRDYIARYADESFFARGLSISKRDELRSKLERAFLGNDLDSGYFRRITSMRETSERYWGRVTRYKCVFLAEHEEFYDLVEKYWQELNDYTGDYLDVFYNPDELCVKGYRTASMLGIRQRIAGYPCIYLWHASFEEGEAIPIGPIGGSANDILTLIKMIVDDIAYGASFTEVVGNARSSVNDLSAAACATEIVEKEFLKQLHMACVELQAAPDMYGDATENQRNRQVRTILDGLFYRPYVLGNSEYVFTALDETRRGRAQGGIMAGELDIFIRLDGQPYAIIEALNLDGGKNGTGWNKGYLANHVVRLGLYDDNGLRRNAILVYVKTGNFGRFFGSFLTSLLNSTRYAIKKNRIYGVEDISHEFNDYANIRVVAARYPYNGLERLLYFLVVGMGSASEAEGRR